MKKFILTNGVSSIRISAKDKLDAQRKLVGLHINTYKYKLIEVTR